jgi:hypothetical protein
VTSDKTRVPIIRTSERRSFKRCPQAWWWGWRMGLVPVGSISDALWFGTGVHIALAAWYCGPGKKRGPEPAETFAAWAVGEIRHIKTSNRFGNAAEALIEEKLVPAQLLGTTLLECYLKEYGRDEHMFVIRPEYSGQINIADPDFADQILAIYAFTYDLVYRDLDDGRILLEEHKTARAIVTSHLKLDDQAGSYWAIADQQLRAEGVLKAKERIRGIEYNFIRKAMPDERPRNAEGYYTNKPTKADYLAAMKSHPDVRVNMKVEELADLAESRGIPVFGEISKLQPKPLFHREFVKRTAAERATQIRRIQNEALVMDAFRTGELPIIKNTTRECNFCQFNGLCELDEGGHDTSDYMRAIYRRKDPYADHRKSTEES